MSKVYSILKKPVFKGLLVLLSCFLSVFQAQADHLSAADLSVKYVGVGQDPCNAQPDYTYEVTFTLYGDCIGLALTDQASIDYESINGGAATAKQSLTVKAVDANGNPVPPGYKGTIVAGLCPAFYNQSNCFNPTNVYPGYFMWTYKGTVTLPSAQTDWKFSFGSCCRNGAVVNLNLYAGFYIEAGINNVAKYNVSTPEFTEFPLPYICANRRFKYLNGPQDGDLQTQGQYLRVISQNPLEGAGTPIGYLPGFSLANPVASTTGYTVNPISGTAEFLPPNQGAYVLGFRLNKYAENDILDPNDDIEIAYTMRDVQIRVLACTEPPPSFQSNGAPINIKNGTWKSLTPTDSAIYVCPGSELSFDLVASNNNPAKKNYLYWSSDNGTAPNKAPGSIFTKVSNAQDTIKASFRWTPTVNQVGDHRVTILAKDSSCDPQLPITLPEPAVYIIRVTKGLDAGPDLLTCKYNPKGYRVLVKGTEYKLKVLWSRLDGSPIKDNIDDSTSIAPFLKAVGATDFVVTTPDLTGTCKVRDTLSFKEDVRNTLNAFPGDVNNTVILCRPDYLQMDAIFEGRKPLTNHSCGYTNRDIDIPKILADKELSKKLDSVNFFGSFAFLPNVTYDTSGASAFNFPTLVRTEKQQFLLTRDEMLRYGLFPSTLLNMSINMAKNNLPDHEYSNFTISLKCTDKSALNRIDGFETGMQPVYSAVGPVTFETGWHTFDFQKAYDWDSTKNLIVEFCYNNNAAVEVCDPAGPGVNVMTYVPTSYVAGLSYIPMKNDVNNNRVPDPDVQDVCGTITNNEIVNHYSRPLMRFKYFEVPDADMKFDWTPGTFLSDSTLQQPLAYVPKTAVYTVRSQGRNGCLLYDTVKVYVPEHDYKLTGDTTICFGEQAVMAVNDGFDFKWYEYKDGKFDDARGSVSCINCKDVVLSPKATTTYKVVVYDSVWCLDTVTTTVTVLPLPEVRILTRDTVVKYGQSIQLLASGAKMYNWMPVTGLNNANISYPTATIQESTTYILGGIGSNGCKAYDTVKVSVDTRDNVFVPSAFSPNGDGKNDLFRITNLTFQRIVEFRVFNRWGQEVYSANGNSGWDGTWKGVPQDMGTYSYQIRIGFPDGYTESYKGEVTLVR